MGSVNDRAISDMRILVADETPYAADALAELLRLEFSCRVFEACEGEQALRVALSERPDVSILDLRMPRLSGIEVARRIRAAHGERPGDAAPRLIAMTGELGMNDPHADLDGSFDAAYAKPLDIDRLLADLTRHWRGGSAPIARVRFDVGECCTRAVREVLPSMAQRGHTAVFDCSDEPVWVEADEAGLRSGLYRLMNGLADVVVEGVLVLQADVRVNPEGEAVLTMTARGTGALAPAARIEHVIERLSLAHRVRPEGAAGRAGREASGVCPSSGGTVFFSSRPGQPGQPSDEAMVCLQWVGGSVERLAEALPRARGARAWIVDTDGPPASMLERRLQRAGWRVRRCESVAAAAHDEANADGRPALVVVHQAAAVTSREVAALARRVRAQTDVLLLVRAGSAALTGPDAAPAIVRVQPLSPADLRRLTADARPDEGDAPA